MIEVKKINEQKYIVTIKEENSSSEHLVTLDDEYYREFADEKISKENLIKRSFEFLLKRESKESILSKFDLKIINNFFPEYENKIKLKI
ncbi:MAG: hypothetical protein U9R41_06465 [Candidatus Marinimicrobia bacterium]|nr:hypothetical protein [Candidatus Neomarinimicrobiota bacterium]